MEKLLKKIHADQSGPDEIMNVENTSFFSYIYSSWLTKYLWKAYRKGITLSDLPSIAQLDSCSYNIQKLENLWNEEVRQRGPTSASLLLVAWRFIRFRFLIACTLNACSQIVKFILQIFLLRKLLEYSESTDRSFSRGMHWIFYIIACDLLQMVLYTWSDIMNQRTALRLKSACLSLLFKKVVSVNVIGQRHPDELMNMLSKDSQKIYDAVNFGTSIVNAPVVIICVAIYISTWMNPLALIGLFVFLLFYLIQYWFGHLISYCEKNVDELTRTRVEKTLEILNNIRSIKIYEWEQYFLQNIINIRRRESRWIWKLTYIKSFLYSVTHAIPIIAFTVTFYIDVICKVSRGSIASKIFPLCVIYIVQLHEALEALKTSLAHLKDSVMTFKRLKNGLLLEDSCCQAMKPYEASQALAIVNGTFVYDIYKKHNHDSENVDDVIKQAISDGIADPERQKLIVGTLEPKRVEILSNINFKAKKGQLIGICGPAGSGKSAFLLAGLGQIKMTSGQLLRQGSSAYVGQRAWMARGTLRDNVLFDEALDRKRYYEAQVVCKLRQDVKKLPDADETLIGDGGLEIDEPLRQRIALARAFYADRDIYFLDDPLNSMEDEISREIFDDLIIRALAEKTIILVTNEIDFLEKCDYVYVMHDGKISEHGRHKELLRLGKEYASMVKAAAADAEGDYANDFEELQADVVPGENENMKNNNEKTSKKNNLSISLITEEVINNVTSKKDTEFKKIKAITYYTFAKSLGSLCLFLPIILIYFIHAAIEIFNLVRLTWWIKAIDTKEIYKYNVFSHYERWCGIMLLLLALGCVVQSAVGQFAITRITNNMHNALLKNIIHAPTRFFDSASFTTMRSHFLRDLNYVSLSLPSKLDNTLRYTAIIFFTFSVLLSTIPWFTNYVVLTIVFFLYIGKIYRAAQINFKRLENKMRLEINSFLQNSLQGLSTIRTFKKENDLLSKFEDLVDHSSACCFVRGVSKSWLASRLEVLTASCLFVASFFTINIQQQISPVVFGLTFVYIFQVPSIIKMGIKCLLKTERCFGYVQDIYEYLLTLRCIDDNDITTVTSATEWSATGHVQLDRVQLRLRDDEPFILDNLSINVVSKEKLGILTKTEAEKNALIAAMYRLHELDGGKIIIDNVDTSTIDIRQLRSQLAFVPENPIFYGTIRCFLDPKKCHNDADIWNALEKMHMKDKVSSVALQLNCFLDKSIFSIAEKQLLFFTRAYLGKNKILLVEENPSVEPQSIALIQRVIDNEFSDSTVLLFAHRPRTVLFCQVVLIIENGGIAEFDYTSNLLSKQDSSLKMMVAEEDENRMGV